ncbi:hypothetical protein O9993_16485 [Vibrio lentus]|nr:hypothetical protein [Vibrio lentus]
MSLLVHGPTLHHNGHDLVQDVHKAGTRIEFEEDQDEVLRSVREGIFACRNVAAVENDLHGQISLSRTREDLMIFGFT